MTALPRRSVRLLAVVAVIAAAPHTSAATGDPARAALRGSSVFVSPKLTLGPDAAARLAAAATSLGREDRPVKFALVTGPVGAPTMLVYARRLRRELRYAGTVVVAAPPSRLGVAGPGDPAVLTRALRTAGVAAMTDPVARAIAAAEAAAPAPPSATGARTRGLLGLLGLALVGGLWAVAIGVRRTYALERRALGDARAAATDSLAALERELEDAATRTDLDSGARDAVERARRDCANARASLARARSVDAVRDIVPAIRAARARGADAGIAIGPEFDRLLAAAMSPGIAIRG